MQWYKVKLALMMEMGMGTIVWQLWAERKQGTWLLMEISRRTPTLHVRYNVQVIQFSVTINLILCKRPPSHIKMLGVLCTFRTSNFVRINSAYRFPCA
jgi:hypothetical protein